MADEGTPQKLFLSDTEVLDRLEHMTPTALARDLGVSRALILKRRDRALRLLEAEALVERRQKLERRRAKRKGRIASASRAPENGPPPKADPPRQRRPSTGKLLPAIVLDQETWEPVGPSGEYARWLDGRDASKPTPADLAADLRVERARRMRLRQLGIPLDYAPCEAEFTAGPAGDASPD